MTQTLASPARPTLRNELEDAVERAIAALDALDGDPDLEPEEDDDRSDREPSLCGVFMPRSGSLGDDREATTPAFVLNQLEGATT